MFPIYLFFIDQVQLALMNKITCSFAIWCYSQWKCVQTLGKLIPRYTLNPGRSSA